MSYYPQTPDLIPWFEWTILSLLGVYLFEQWLQWKQRQRLKEPLPLKLENDIPLHEYLDKQRYALKKSRLRFIQDTVNLVHSLSRLWRLSLFWSLAQTLSPIENNIATSIIFLSLFSLEKTLINLPFSLYRRLYLRHPVKAYTQSILVYLFEKTKLIVYRGILHLPLITVILSVEPWLRPSFALYAWLAIIIESIGVWMLYPTYIAPYFHRFTSVPPGELRNRLLTLCLRTNFPMNCIVIDQSSGKVDVHFHGVFPPKYLAISAPAMRILDPQTITTLGAHEIARWKGAHSVVWYIIRLLYNGFYVYMLERHIYDSKLYADFNIPNQLIIGYVILSIMYTPIQNLYLLLEHVVIRELECQADMAVAREQIDMKKALLKVSAIKQSTIDRDPDYAVYFKDKPSLMERLNNLDRHT